MHKFRRAAPGSSPATLIPHLVDGQPSRPKIQLIEYDKNTLEETEILDVAQLSSCLEKRRTSWINIDGLGDLETLKSIGEIFNLHPLTLEDVLNTGQRPKTEVYPDYLFIVAQMLYANEEGDLCGEQVSMFLGRGFLITIQEEEDMDVFNPVRERIRSGRGTIRQAKADYLAYALVDSIVDHYFPVLEQLGGDLDTLEEEVMENPPRGVVHTLHDYKRNLSQLRRFLWPLRDVVNSMLHDNSGFIASPTKVFLRDCYDHTIQLMDLVESYKEITSGLMELYHSTVGMRTNETMRVLTVITSIFIPLTFIAGVYGMNFAPESPTGKRLPWNMPELYLPHGYVDVIAIMAVIAIVQLIIFKKMKWL